LIHGAQGKTIKFPFSIGDFQRVFIICASRKSLFFFITLRSTFAHGIAHPVMKITFQSSLFTNPFHQKTSFSTITFSRMSPFFIVFER